MEDLQKYHGKRFRAKIDGVVCEGQISVCGRYLYLCQNLVDGMPAPDRLGFGCSWSVFVSQNDRSVEDALIDTSVLDFEFLDDYITIETTHFLTI